MGTGDLGERLYEDGTLAQQKCVAVIISALFAPAFYIAGFKGAAAVCAIGIAAQFIIFIFSFEKTSIENFGCAFIPTFYPSVFLVFMSAANYLPAYSTAALVSVFAICSLTDTFAFFTGITFKGRKLCPTISPLKTVAGAIGGLFGGVIGALLVYFLLGGWLGKAVPAIWIMIIAGLLGGVINQLGDLAEIAVKRKLGLKDMGNLLPGHGGMMDRIDGIVFTAPILYLLFAFI